MTVSPSPDKSVPSTGRTSRPWPAVLIPAVLLALVITISSCLSVNVDPKMTTAKVKDQAPAFTLTSQENKEVSLSDLHQDGPVVVAFFRGVW